MNIIIMMQNDVVGGGQWGQTEKPGSGLEFPTLEPPDLMCK